GVLNNDSDKVSEIIISPCPSVYELWESGVAFRIFLCPILLVANL
ncbi:hypothetical protein WG66_004276, partial [Moniliophthora roreri]